MHEIWKGKTVYKNKAVAVLQAGDLNNLTGDLRGSINRASKVFSYIFFNPSNGNRSEPYKTTFRSSNVFWENVPAAEMPTYRY